MATSQFVCISYTTSQTEALAKAENQFLQRARAFNNKKCITGPIFSNSLETLQTPPFWQLLFVSYILSFEYPFILPFLALCAFSTFFFLAQNFLLPHCGWSYLSSCQKMPSRFWLGGCLTREILILKSAHKNEEIYLFCHFYETPFKKLYFMG